VELNITVTTADDRWQVKTNPWVIMQWERRFKTKASNLANVGIGIEDLAFLAYEATKITGRTVPMNFDTFAQAITNIEVDSEVDAARPTVAAASAD
jgi:hypothetical protein